jgi:maleylacetate reductase
MNAVNYTAHAARIVFGSGTIASVRTEVERLGGTKVLVLASADRAEHGDLVSHALGQMAVGRFDGAEMHTPVEVTKKALALLEDVAADCVVAVGGGSTTGLAKALAARTGVDQLIVPTTYAGSEVTPVLGETDSGVKTARSGPEILPEAVIYDVDLTLGLPIALTVTSAVNALAHAVEAMYAPDANPVTDALALTSISKLAQGLSEIADSPRDPTLRRALLEGAWLAGTCLGSVGMGLHHKLCHTLGGSFGLPHAPTHTVVLPYAMAYNAAAVPETMTRIAAALGALDAPQAVFDLITSAGGPTSLAELGFTDGDVDRCVNLATAKPYPNPAPVTDNGIRELLHGAIKGTRPVGDPLAATLDRLRTQVTASFAAAADARTRALLTDLAPRLHAYAIDNDLTQDEWQYGIEFLTRTGQMCSDTRQEFILLSDTLGLSSVVDALTNSRTPDSTASAVLGPFYVDGAPELDQGADVSNGLTGTPLWVDVTIADTNGNALPDATVDVWQSNDDGFYDVQLPDLDGPVLRGRFRTDADGRLRFRTILPSEYPIPTDGPVGTMLKASGRHPYRAPHLHFMIHAAGHRPLITQLFVEGGKFLDSDAVFGVKDALIIPFTRHDGPTPDATTADQGWRSVDFAFRIAPLEDTR